MQDVNQMAGLVDSDDDNYPDYFDHYPNDGDKNNEAIHYVKGRDGVKMLLQWWLNDICDT